MRVLVIAFSLCALSLSRVAADPSLVDVELGDEIGPEEFLALGLGDLDIFEMDGRRLRALVTPEERARLESLGLKITELPLPGITPAAVDGFLTFSEYLSDMQAWVAARPDIVSLQSLGQSWEGRDIWLLKISDNVSVDEDEPEVLMLSLQHAREWLGGMTLHGITEHLIKRDEDLQLIAQVQG